jgi:hypothetical protein
MKKKKKNKKSPTPSKPISLRFMLGFAVSVLLLSSIVFAAIRMTDDPKPKRIIYRVKDVNTGIISSKYESEDLDFHYEIGDFFEEGTTNYNQVGGTWINNSNYHKYVVIGKKNATK